MIDEVIRDQSMMQQVCDSKCDNYGKKINDFYEQFYCVLE
jgi:hypothetical protein